MTSPGRSSRPPRRRFGQHFLEPAWVSKVVSAIQPKPSDVFVEVGPGRGALTYSLTSAAAKVVAVEVDRDLVQELGANAPSNLTVIAEDFLQVSPDQLRTALGTMAGVNTTLRLAGNLPYNAASPILFKVLELYADGLSFQDATVMVQREVADRLLAKAGTRDYGVMTIFVCQAADVTPLLALPPGAFRPPPKVHSSLVKLRLHPLKPAARDARLFSRLVHAVFSRRRKMLSNALMALVDQDPSILADRESIRTVLARAELDPRRRPETLTLGEFVHLADAIVESS